jgi:sugar lactone lactonase YvrE
MRSFVVMALAVGGCTGEQEPGTIVTVAGTGLAAFTGDGEDPALTPLYSPLQVFFQLDGTPMIVDWNNHRVRAIKADVMTTVIGTGLFIGAADPNSSPLDFALHHPYQFETAADGQIYFAGYHDPRAFRIDAGDIVRVVAGFGAVGSGGDGGPAVLAFLANPTGIAVAPDGTVFIADEVNSSVRRVGPDGIIDRIAGTGTVAYSGDGGAAIEAGLRAPTRLALDAGGNLYICDTGNHVIRRIDRDGIITTFAGNGTPAYAGDGGPANEASLNLPRDLAVAPAGEILIADTGNNVVRAVSTDGTIRTIVGTGAAGFAGDGDLAQLAQLYAPYGIELAKDGMLWIADTYNHRVRRVAPKK